MLCNLMEDGKVASVCMYMWLFVCMCVHVCIHVCIYPCVCLYNVCACACVQMSMCVCTHACMHVCVHACMCVCMNACVCLCVCMYVCVCGGGGLCVCVCTLANCVHDAYYCRRYAIITGQTVTLRLLESSKLSYWNKKNRLAFSFTSLLSSIRRLNYTQSYYC